VKLIPGKPHNTTSNAELKVFEKLADSEFADHHPVGFHSLLLTKHDYKRVGEADFVVVSIYGVFVLEVKGGKISYVDGKWSTAGRNGIDQIQDPFHQANTAVHAIIKKIDDYLGQHKVRFPIGYGVVCPDTLWPSYGGEWDREMICDSRDFRNFNHWLKALFDYWTIERPNNDQLLSQADVDAIAAYLRPDFETIQPLFDHVKQVEQSSVRLTEEQYKFVDIAEINKRVICHGGAGTGKTFLAAELSRRFIAKGLNTLFVCKSSWLRHYLTTRIQNDRLVIATISSVGNALRRSGLDVFDALIVDEGQDLLNFQDLQLLDSLIAGGFDNGQWYFFHDVNNQANLLDKLDTEAFSWLKNRNNPTLLPLSVNCRNTSNILKSVQKELTCDVGIPTLADGPEVTEYHGNESELVGSLEKLITELANSELMPGSVTILSPISKRKSIIKKLPAATLELISELDDYVVRKLPFEGITFSKIQDFKGLENDVIILVDLVHPSKLSDDESKALHYVGMTRARAMLYCLWSE